MGPTVSGVSGADPVCPRAPSRKPSSVTCQQLVRVDDPVRVPLLGQEPLAVRREVLVDGVARDDRVEPRLVPVGLRPQDAPEPLRLLLARPEGPGDLDGDGGLRQVDGEVGDLGDDEDADLPVPERAEELLALGVAGLALDDGGVRCSPSSSS